MPATRLNRNQRKPKEFVKWLYGEMADKDISQEEIAEWIGITHQAVSYKLRKYSFSYIEMLMIFDELGTEKEERIKVLL